MQVTRKILPTRNILLPLIPPAPTSGISGMVVNIPFPSHQSHHTLRGWDGGSGIKRSKWYNS